MYKPLLGILVALSLTACSDVPSESDIEELVEQNLVDSGTDQYFDIDDFELVDGIERDKGRYDADVKYKLIVTKDSDEIAQELKQSGNSFESAAVMMALTFQLGSNFKAGKELPVSETLNLEESDNGWRLR
jgi:hypothetical protein